jgi:hypothetical protein
LIKERSYRRIRCEHRRDRRPIRSRSPGPKTRHCLPVKDYTLDLRLGREESLDHQGKFRNHRAS